jgi:hypothetical protein
MRNCVLALALLCLFSVSAEAAGSDVILTLSVPHDLVVWVEAKTGIRLPDVPKIIVVENNDPLFQSGDAFHAEHDAAYLNGTIYFPIRSIVHFQEPAYQALTVHELVHATQDHNGRSYTCTGQREAEAYSFQNQYLIEHGRFPAMAAEIIAAMRECKEHF